MNEKSLKTNHRVNPVFGKDAETVVVRIGVHRRSLIRQWLQWSSRLPKSWSSPRRNGLRTIRWCVQEMWEEQGTLGKTLSQVGSQEDAYEDSQPVGAPSQKLPPIREDENGAGPSSRVETGMDTLDVNLTEREKAKAARRALLMAPPREKSKNRIFIPSHRRASRTGKWCYRWEWVPAESGIKDTIV